MADTPEPGCYKMRLVKGGWEAPCLIVQDADGWHSVVDEGVGQSSHNPWTAGGIASIHAYGLKITRNEYDYLIGLKKWAAKEAPSHPCLDAYHPIDPSRLQPIMPRKRS